MSDNQYEADFMKDLIAALSEINNPALDGRANYGKYATIQSCLKASKSVLPKHNLGIVQLFHTDPDRLVTRIVHASGGWIEDGGVPIHCVDKNNPQKLIGAGTYARRAGICAALGIAGEEDDDGQRATPPKELPKPKKEWVPEHRPKSAADIDVTRPKIVSDEIPFDKKDGHRDWESWVNKAIAGMTKHKHTAEHMNWSKTNYQYLRSLEKENSDLHKKLLDAYLQTKSELENKR